ncbi:type I glyceraldehyde-3-phosphate dehydrogenase [Candidatus Parcubacteria bacterium]|nr:type I glyceraldehyde-3-phosphate dehydrogenase [Candidatus Parcubacteria bacterium]
MPTRIAINGFGRIGRNAFKIAFGHPDLQIVAINDLTDTKTLAYLLRHDSNYGTYHHEVGHGDGAITVDGRSIKVTAEKDPALLSWKDLAVDVVIESTGRFTKAEDASKHLTAGAKRVVLSAPGKGDGIGTFVMGVNQDKVTAENKLVSNASCTTNCITPVAAIVARKFGIDKAMMTTVHSYTASQALQDAPAKDLREGRNAAENIVPTTTGATVAAAKALPELDGVFAGLSIRVPTPVVSLSDFTFVTKQATSIEEVNKALEEAAASPAYRGILAVTGEELVSSDLVGDSHSATVDLNLTNVVGGNLVKVVAWYDNEWGYSNRLVEMVLLAGKTIAAAPQTVESPATATAAAAATVTAGNSAGGPEEEVKPAK